MSSIDTLMDELEDQENWEVGEGSMGDERIDSPKGSVTLHRSGFVTILIAYPEHNKVLRFEGLSPHRERVADWARRMVRRTIGEHEEKEAAAALKELIKKPPTAKQLFQRMENTTDWTFDRIDRGSRSHSMGLQIYYDVITDTVTIEGRKQKLHIEGSHPLSQVAKRAYEVIREMSLMQYADEAAAKLLK